MEGTIALPPPLDACSHPPHPNAQLSDQHASPPPPSNIFTPSAPPPPPPPPPPLEPPGLTRGRGARRHSMKKVNWDAIPHQSVIGKLNVWTSERSHKNLVLDTHIMEELFSVAENRSGPQQQSHSLGRKSFKGGPPLTQQTQVSILNSKKSMNLTIFLKQFKRPVKELVEDIRHGNWLRFGSGKLKELCKMLPEESEVRQLQSYSGNLAKLPEADQFMVELVKVPRYEDQLKTLVLREEFFPLMEEVKNSTAVLTKAAKELLDCDDLHSVIRLVLKAGNYMNAGGYSANAIGFRMASLLKLADTKANKPGMNLMHFVAKQAEVIDPVLLTFSSQLEHIGKALRCSKEEVEKDFQREVQKIKEVKLFASRQPDLFQKPDTFLLRADAMLSDVELSLQELSSQSRMVEEFFCEDPSVFKLEECCSIFSSFCRKFDVAIQENHAREAADLRRQQREIVQNSARRRSARSVTSDDSQSSMVASSLETQLPHCGRNRPKQRRGLSPVTASPAEVAGSSAEVLSLIDMSTEELEDSGRGQEERSPEKKQPKLRGDGTGEGTTKPAVVNEQKAEKMHKVVCHHRSYLVSLGNPDSPWTILSPLSCPRGSTPRQRNRRNLRL